MRIVFTGGGTGGHTYPLVAVSREIKKIYLLQNLQLPEMIFIGSEDFSADAFAQENIETRFIYAGKLRRYFSWLNFIDLIIKLPVGIIQSFWHLFWIMPDIVFSKGGYGSVPVVLVSWIFRIPIIVHESDTVPGLANKFSAKFAKYVGISFVESAEFFSRKKTALVGNPIRTELATGSKEGAKKDLNLASDKPIIFIWGGSQGAQAINDLVLLDLQNLVQKYEIIHQCGAANFEKFRKDLINFFPNGDPQNYHLLSYLSESQMKNAYAAADLIVSRAGSNSIFEIAASGKPCILIPLDESAKDHQMKNALAYAQTGAASIVRQSNLTPHILENEIDTILNNHELTLKMSAKALDFAKPEAAKKIAEIIILILNRK